MNRCPIPCFRDVTLSMRLGLCFWHDILFALNENNISIVGWQSTLFQSKYNMYDTWNSQMTFWCHVAVHHFNQTIWQKHDVISVSTRSKILDVYDSYSWHWYFSPIDNSRLKKERSNFAKQILKVAAMFPVWNRLTIYTKIYIARSLTQFSLISHIFHRKG